MFPARAAADDCCQVPPIPSRCRCRAGRNDRLSGSGERQVKTRRRYSCLTVVLLGIYHPAKVATYLPLT